MKRTDLAYMAGILDGEAGITITHRKSGEHISYNIVIWLEMRNSWLPRWFQFSFGGKYYSRQRKHSDNRSYIWKITGASAIDCLNSLYPYLHLKKGEADIVFRLWSIKVPRKWSTKETSALQEAEAVALNYIHTRGGKH